MMQATAAKLAETAEELALFPFHGNADGEPSNIAPLIAPFPKWSVSAADGAWCAAFVYYCCLTAGYEIPYSPEECVTCSLAGCGGREEFAIGDSRVRYFRAAEGVAPRRGDIVLFDRVFSGKEHDHIGILLRISDMHIVTAEGNVEDRSRIVTRCRDDHIRAFIRLPDGYKY